VQQQSHGYSRDLMFPKGLKPKRIKQPLKTWISLIKRIPFVGSQLKEDFLKSLIKHGYPYDQTQKDALAQIEIIVKKVQN